MPFSESHFSNILLIILRVDTEKYYKIHFKNDCWALLSELSFNNFFAWIQAECTFY